MSDRVSIQCTDRRHHGRTVLIDTFRRIPSEEDPSELVWVGDHAQYTTHHAGTQQHLSTYSARVDESTGETYAVYRLHCNLCKRSVPAKRKRLWTALDALAKHDADPTELKVLAAIVSKQK